jgi:hypothetical protein
MCDRSELGIPYLADLAPIGNGRLRAVEMDPGNTELAFSNAVELWRSSHTPPGPNA